MRERILQILDAYDTNLGSDDNGEIAWGIPSDQFEDVVQEIVDVIEGNNASDDISTDTCLADEPYHNLPNLTFSDEPCPTPKVASSRRLGTRYVTKR